MAERKILLGNVVVAARYIGLARKLLAQTKRLKFPSSRHPLEGGTYIVTTPGKPLDTIMIYGGGGLLKLVFTADSTDKTLLYGWRGTGAAAQVSTISDAALTADVVAGHTLSNFYGRKAVYQVLSTSALPTFNSIGAAELVVDSGINPSALDLAFAEGETVRPYEKVYVLPDGRQLIYCGPYQFSDAADEAVWYERSRTDGLFRELFTLPVTGTVYFPRDLFWPARGFDSRGYAAVTGTAIYMRGSYSDDTNPASIDIYYELWKFPVTADGTDPSVVGTPVLAAAWFGTRFGAKYKFHSFLHDPAGEEGGYVESLYTTAAPVTYGDTVNVYLFNGLIADFSLDLAALLGYTRVANSATRSVKVWKIRAGVYGLHVMNTLTFANSPSYPDTINDALIKIEIDPDTLAVSTSVVYKTEDNRSTLMGFGSSVVNPAKLNEIVITESDRVGVSDTATNFVSYVVDMDTAKRTPVSENVLPSKTQWVI